MLLPKKKKKTQANGILHNLATQNVSLLVDY